MKNYIEKLKEIGLTEYEAKAYFHLLKKKFFSASELASLANVPRTRVYEVLNSLIKKGFATKMPGKIKKFSAISPMFAFNNVVKEMEDEVDRQKNNINKITQSLTPLYESKKDNTDPYDYIEIVRERNRIIEVVSKLGEAAQKEIVSMNRPPYAINISNMKKRKKISDKKGLRYRFLAQASDFEDENYGKFMELWQKSGAIVRVTNETPVKLLIFDQKTIVISLPDRIAGEESVTAMIIEHPDLAKFFYRIFNVYFSRAITLEEFYQQKKEEK
jgi:sugar-specific transcriptional regulator TrmB